MKKKILCFGDSNTWGAEPFAHRYDEDTRWTMRMWESLGRENYHVFERGLSGRTSVWDDPYTPNRNGKTGLMYALSAARPLDLVIIMLGTNDLQTQYGNCTNAVALGMNALIDQVKDAVCGRDGKLPEILLASPVFIGENITSSPFALHYDETSRGKSAELAELYEKIARAQGVHFLDAALYAKAGADSLHMDRQSHAALADAMTKKVREILE